MFASAEGWDADSTVELKSHVVKTVGWNVGLLQSFRAINVSIALRHDSSDSPWWISCMRFWSTMMSDWVRKGSICMVREDKSVLVLVQHV